MPPSQRGAFVASACNRDPALLQEVTSLLEVEQSSGDFLESPVFEIGLKIISSNNRRIATAPSPDNLIGRTIEERYLVEKELGHGGMGKVYLARDLKLHNRPVVIKVLLEASLHDPYVVKKFRQEVEALARIDHPNVVNVLGAGELEGGKPFIVMQFVTGTTLRSQIDSAGMNLTRTAAILKQVGSALDDVHEKGIFHRDLKPDNIMLQRKSGGELVKIVDFGIAKVKDSVVAPSTVNQVPVGTLLYMSPEQLRGGAKITAASDIYSMGVIAYEMITGRRPFNPESGPQLLEMHRAGVRVRPIDLRSGLSTEAQAIVLRALSFEAAARYQSAAEFGDSLARALMIDEDTGTPKALKPLELIKPVTAQQEALQNTSWNNVTAAFRKQRTKVAAVISAVLLLCIGGWVVYKILRSGQPQFEAASRSFTYWLTVQKMRDGRKYEEPFQSSGQEIFETGYKFRLNVNSADSGYLYLFNEGPPTSEGTTFTLIYPTPSRNKGSAAVLANQTISTNWNTFHGKSGVEYFWIVWADTPVTELEAAKNDAFDREDFAPSDHHVIAVKKYLETIVAAVRVQDSKDKVSQMVTVRGPGHVLVRQTELQHR